MLPAAPDSNRESRSGTPVRMPVVDVVGAVKAHNAFFEVLLGEEGLRALEQGDGSAAIDRVAWAIAWENARNFRDQILLTLARATRDSFRRDAMEIANSAPEGEQAGMILEAFRRRIRLVFDFAFAFLTRRQVCFLADAVALAFESEMQPDEFAVELAPVVATCAGASTEMLDAVVMGTSGMHRYDPGKLLALPSGRGRGGASA